jgi:hypothetical protein
MLLSVLAIYAYVRIEPIARSFELSFYDWLLIARMRPYVGVANYVRIGCGRMIAALPFIMIPLEGGGFAESPRRSWRGRRLRDPSGQATRLSLMRVTLRHQDAGLPALVRLRGTLNLIGQVPRRPMPVCRGLHITT